MQDLAQWAPRRLPTLASLALPSIVPRSAKLGSIVLGSIMLAAAVVVSAGPARADGKAHRYEILNDERRALGAFLTIRGERQRRKPMRSAAPPHDRGNLASTMEARWRSFDLAWQQALETVDTATMTRTMPVSSSSLQGRWTAPGTSARAGLLSHAGVRLAQTRTSRTIDSPSIFEIATLEGGPLSREAALVLGLASGTTMTLSSRRVSETDETRFFEILEARQSGRVGMFDLAMASRYERPRSDLDAAVMAGELHAGIEPGDGLRLVLTGEAMRRSLDDETADRLGVRGGLDFEARAARHVPGEPWKTRIEAGADLAGRRPGQRPDRLERAYLRLGMSRRF